MDVVTPLTQASVPLTPATTSQEVGHTAAGTSWGTSSSAVYAATRHGPDGARFLDPHFLPWVRSVAGMKVVDIGCGAGPWAVEAAQSAALRVEALDIQQSMVDLASAAVRENGMANIVNVTVGDAANLQFPDAQFDRAFSINVGCNLPAGSFEKHFKEMHRVLRPGGIGVVTAPANLDLVFSDGAVPQAELLSNIHAKLAAIGFTSESSAVLPHLNQLNGIYRATFYPTPQGVHLMEPGTVLESGAPIWRRIPGQAVPNRYHHESEYERAAKEAGFVINEVSCSHFASENEREAHNLANTGKLGVEYVERNAFLVLVLEKS